MSRPGRRAKARQGLGNQPCIAELRSAGQVGHPSTSLRTGSAPTCSYVNSGLSLQNRGGVGAELVERAFQLGGDIRCLAMLDVAALHHVDYFTVAQQRDRR